MFDAGFLDNEIVDRGSKVGICVLEDFELVDNSSGIGDRTILLATDKASSVLFDDCESTEISWISASIEREAASLPFFTSESGTSQTCTKRSPSAEDTKRFGGEG